MDETKKHPGCINIIFGVHSNKDPTPIMVKKMLLVWVSAYFICHTGTTSKLKKYTSEYVHAIIQAVFGHSHSNEMGTMLYYTVLDDHCWHMVHVCYPIDVYI